MDRYYVLAMSHVDLGFTTSEAELSEYLEVLLTRVLDVMDREPQVIFGIEQMYHYRALQVRRPDLVERVKARIAQGRIEVLGAMASTLETNMPDGECFVRNARLGQAWSMDHFGVSATDGWLIDTFGMHAQLPQVYRQMGISRVWANRFGGNVNLNLFHAVGLDGTKLLVCGWDSGSANVPADIFATKLCRGYRDVDALFEAADRLDGDDPRMALYYLENEEHYSLRYLEHLRERQNRPGQRWKLAGFGEYLDALTKARTQIPEVSADLNPEFTATFSLRMPVKTENRKAETALLEAEKWCALMGVTDEERLITKSWWDMAFCQFHDVFSGSHGDDTFENTMGKYHLVRERAEALMRRAFEERVADMAQGLLAVSGLPFETEQWIRLPDRYKGFGIAHGGCSYIKAALPAVGCAAFAPQTAQKEERMVFQSYIENEYMRLTLDTQTGLKELRLEDGSVLITDAQDFLTAQQDDGGFQIEEPTGCELYPPQGKYEVSAVLQSDMGQEITLSGNFRPMPWCRENELSFSVRFLLIQGEKALRVSVRLNWLGEGTRIRMKLPCKIDNAKGLYEIPFGVVSRGAYDGRRTARGEWPARRFVAVQDGVLGMALINRGVAGAEMVGSTMAVTLLRAYKKGPMAWVPPTALSSCHGQSEYDFMLAPYHGDLANSEVYRMAQAFNNPATILGRSVSQACSFLALEPHHLILSSVKRADDGSGDIMVRYYETAGIPAHARLFIKGARAVYLSDLSEASYGEIECTGGNVVVLCAPLEIQTLRVLLGK